MYPWVEICWYFRMDCHCFCMCLRRQTDTSAIYILFNYLKVTPLVYHKLTKCTHLNILANPVTTVDGIKKEIGMARPSNMAN